MNEFDLIVVGGGPAGYFAAIRFAELCPQASVLILESSHTPLQKVLVSGGGRCNITHKMDDPKVLIKFYPRGGKDLLNAFYQFGPSDLVNWFEKRGLKFYVDETGCLFPVTDDASSVVKILTDSVKALGIRVWLEAALNSLNYDSENHEYRLGISNGDLLKSHLVLISTGGNRQGFRILRKLGLDIVPPVPSLFTFRLQESLMTQLAGITVNNVALSLPGTTINQTGPLLITHQGLSGPAVINLSAWAARLLYESGYKCELLIDWLPSSGSTDFSLNTLTAYKDKHGSQPLGKTSIIDKIPLRLWGALVKRSGLDADMRWGDLTKKQVIALNSQIRYGEFLVTGRDPHKLEYVTCGGVD
ncbi:MAG: aminoacetone oxidase family FAD-binding enzyme, partial [Anaerolineaceae bacterium]|nr:aminoacetone oxidase family FAD-binding enzyme [Anaerolineaceae bacterium]